MPISDIPRRARELGRIRAGEYKPSDNHPTSTETWRLTSPHHNLLEVAQVIYGGNLEAMDRKDSADRFQLLTESDRLQVVVPPQDVSENQWYELYTSAGLKRRCDGEYLQAGADFDPTTPGLCPCDPDRRECRATTHLQLILPDLPDVGTWRLTTRSIYAAAELPQQVEFLTMAASFPRAVLVLDPRTTKKPGGGRHNYNVPILTTDATISQILSGAHAGDGPAGITGESPPPALPPAAPPDNPGSYPPPLAAAAPEPVAPTNNPIQPPRPLETILAPLEAALETRPGQLPHAAALTDWLEKIYEASEHPGIRLWDNTTLDELAVKHLKAFRDFGALDMVSDSFLSRAAASSVPDLRTFATRLWLEASTYVNERKTNRQ